jgi:hypothetical protein
VVIPNRHSSFKITKGQDRNDMRALFGLDIKLACDFIDGLVKVTGSGSYLHDRIRNNDIMKMNLEYKVTTVYRGLKPYALYENTGMEWLLTIPDILTAYKKGIATHIVVGIEYGATAIFVFEKKVDDLSDVNSLIAHLQVTIQKLPVKIDAKGDLRMNQSKVLKNDDLNIKFFGDYVLKVISMIRATMLKKRYYL